MAEVGIISILSILESQEERQREVSGDSRCKLLFSKALTSAAYGGAPEKAYGFGRPPLELIVEPMSRPSLLELLSTWEPLDEEFPEIDDLKPVEDVDL